MRIARLAGLVFVAALVVCLVGAVSAMAEDVLFNPGSGTFLAITDGIAKLSGNGGTDVVNCEESHTNGTVVNRDLLLFQIHFLECEGSKESGKNPCPVHSLPELNNNDELILTETLHAVLGLILPHIPAVLILPTGSKVFVTLGGNCISETQVTGNLTGEISPVAHAQTTGKIVTGEGINNHFIATLGGGLTIAKLVAFGSTSFESATGLITWSQAIEVT